MQEVVMGLTHTDFQHVRKLARASGRRGVRLTGKSGTARFYLKGEQLCADVRNEDNTILTQRVVDVTDPSSLPKDNLFKDTLKPLIQKDHPEFTENEADALADYLAEANVSIKRLVQAGVEPNMALEIVKKTLEGDFFPESNEKKEESK